MDKVAGSGNDEFYTPKYAVQPIVAYLKAKQFSSVWCPFDKAESNFVEVLRNEGFKVFYTHLDYELDFFTEPLPPCDCIVSNPPYSMKAEVFDRLFQIGKPFAMLVGIVGLFESQKRFNMFASNKFEILYLNKRIAYFKDMQEQKPSLNPPFSSGYVCSGILPDRICFAEVAKK